MKERQILGIPTRFFCVTVFALCIGIIIGSFRDYRISEVLSNKTDIGNFFQNYASIISFGLYPTAGMCIYKGLKKVNKKYSFLAWGTFIVSFFIGLYHCNDVCGKNLRQAFGYVAGETSYLPALLSFLTFFFVLLTIPLFMYIILDDSDPTMLIAIGIVILAAGIISVTANQWLKQVGARPRYKYLLTTDDPAGEFRNWWEMIPYLSSSSDYASWPSGHMTFASLMFSLPMLGHVIKGKKESTPYILFAFAILWNVIFAYNRIHMNAHFLTDVCFGVLITYIIQAVIYKVTFLMIDQ